jgi:lipopolysaccharide/colanic/teichoic acid biosynthesis glycosyltransferase
MVLPAWLRKANAKLFRNRLARNGSLLSAKDFRSLTARECVRADRSQLPLAILMIELPATASTNRDFAYLSKVLHRRLRDTDTAGYVGDGRIGALLPDTPEAGAWKVASDVCDLYPVGRGRPNCEVVVYPKDSTPPTSDRRQQQEQPAGSAASPIDALLTQPTPMIKRAIDIVGATVGLILAAPIIAVFALLIKLTSPGPVFYSQLREGHGGRRFYMYKLRSMRVDAHNHQAALREFSEQDGPAFKMRHDPRTTWIGRIMRMTSLDELPQLWNVLVGEMSLVGPRPLPVDESAQCASWQRRRLAVPPGLTCLWQVKGRSTVSFDSWMRMDLDYLRRRSLAYDVRLLLWTIPSLVFHRGPR